MKNDLESLFRDAERISPAPDLWRRIAEGSTLAPGGRAGREGGGGRGEWLEVRYLRAAGMILAAGLLGLAAFGFLRHRPGDPVREASAAQSEAPAQGEPQVFDPELLEWQADLGDYELVADQAEEVL